MFSIFISLLSFFLFLYGNLHNLKRKQQKRIIFFLQETQRSISRQRKQQQLQNLFFWLIMQDTCQRKYWQIPFLTQNHIKASSIKRVKLVNCKKVYLLYFRISLKAKSNKAFNQSSSSSTPVVHTHVNRRTILHSCSFNFAFYSNIHLGIHWLNEKEKGERENEKSYK